MSISEYLVEWLKRVGRADRTVVDTLAAAVVLGLLVAMAFGA